MLSCVIYLSNFSYVPHPFHHPFDILPSRGNQSNEIYLLLRQAIKMWFSRCGLLPGLALLNILYVILQKSYSIANAPLLASRQRSLFFHLRNPVLPHFVMLPAHLSSFQSFPLLRSLQFKPIATLRSHVQPRPVLFPLQNPQMSFLPSPLPLLRVYQPS